MPTGSSRSRKAASVATDRSPAEPSPLRALLGSAATRFGLDDALATGTLWKRWAEVVGPDVAAHAQPTSLRAGVLRIRADSPVWAHEMGYLAEEIRRKVNAALGGDAVTEVRVWTGAGEPSGARSSRTGAAPRRPLTGRGSEASSGPADPSHVDPLEALNAARRAWQDRRRRSRETGH